MSPSWPAASRLSKMIRKMAVTTTPSTRCSATAEGTAVGLVEGGVYSERGAALVLGTVDLSSQELELPTHAVSEGLYLSHMAVAAFARKRGVGRQLLAAARECAISRGEECIYLHVEPANAAAVATLPREGRRVRDQHHLA